MFALRTQLDTCVFADVDSAFKARPEAHYLRRLNHFNICRHVVANEIVAVDILIQSASAHSPA